MITPRKECLAAQMMTKLCILHTAGMYRVPALLLARLATARNGMQPKALAMVYEFAWDVPPSGNRFPRS